MRQFMRNLPAYLSRTDVVLELRDARLPLTSINTTFEGIYVLHVSMLAILHPFALLQDPFINSFCASSNLEAGSRIVSAMAPGDSNRSTLDNY